MASRRKIREAAVQFLYCADLEGGADPSDVTDPFWEFINESDQRKLLTAMFRMVHHLAQGRNQRVSEWTKRQKQALEILGGWPEASSLAAILQRIAASEAKWSAVIERLQRISLDGEDALIIARLESTLDELFTIDHSLEVSRSEFLLGIEDFPQLTGPLEAICASTRRLQRISDRLRMVENPGNFPEQADLKKLRESKSEMDQLRSNTTDLLTKVTSNRASIDKALADVIENYAPERIDPVDRSILRLATYELMETDTPSKVILNEAIELAKRYGTSDSFRFVNGVLDKIASQSSEA